ncbi:MAG: alpha-glucosidase C-terminal domain-containing protein [Ignavibacteriaceae bacterium]|nr:alpha-glucosidase C-terminal domain-containing protein [Ignavibacteriaceae bacterium]
MPHLFHAQQHTFTPEWAKHAIWYQIFPERFSNGDPSNDPTVKDIIGADPQERPAAWEVHPWNSDWYELQEYEKVNAELDGNPALWKHLLRRRYGGDIQGIINKLGYLKELGINAIYLNPVFDSPSLHKYDGASYHHIDPNFGPDPIGDRLMMEKEDPSDPSTWVWTKADELALELIEKAHSLGMRIIFDGVFNHLGINSFAFRDVVKNQQNSKYKDWFIIKSWEDKSNGTKFDYEGWWGVKSLPELREDESGIVKGPKDYIFAATERWMNPKGKGTRYGIDGWRLDVAFCVSHNFWKDWRKHVKGINPEAYITAELVLPLEDVKPYLQGDEFDGEMNYIFAFACADFLFTSPDKTITPSQFDKQLEFLRNAYPAEVSYVTQNLFGSHDAARIGTHIVNRGIERYSDWGKYFGASKAADNPEYRVRKPYDYEKQLQKLFAIIQFTYVGAPMIYYGDEAGMWGANDPDCRKPMVWKEINYKPEKYNPDGSTRKPDEVRFDDDLFNHYKKLADIRNTYSALRSGGYQTIITNDKKKIFGYSRKENEQELIVLINNSENKTDVDVPAEKNSTFTELLSGESLNASGGSLKISLPAKWGVILYNGK